MKIIKFCTTLLYAVVISILTDGSLSFQQCTTGDTKYLGDQKIQESISNITLDQKVQFVMVPNLFSTQRIR